MTDYREDWRQVPPIQHGGAIFWVEVTNPESGRPVYLGGPTYNKLVENGVINPAMLEQLNPRVAFRNNNTDRLNLLETKEGYPSRYRGPREERMNSPPGTMTTKIISPESGHRIVVGGPEYYNLVQRGMINPSQLGLYDPQPAVVSPLTGRSEMVGGRAYDETRNGRTSPRGYGTRDGRTSPRGYGTQAQW